jgi:hypothetical protein
LAIIYSMSVTAAKYYLGSLGYSKSNSICSFGCSIVKVYKAIRITFKVIITLACWPAQYFLVCYPWSKGQYNSRQNCPYLGSLGDTTANGIHYICCWIAQGAKGKLDLFLPWLVTKQQIKLNLYLSPKEPRHSQQWPNLYIGSRTKEIKANWCNV